MTTLADTDKAQLPLGKRGAFEGVARRPDAGGTPARRPPRSSLRTPTNPSRHSAQRWFEKCGRSVTNSETPQDGWQIPVGQVDVDRFQEGQPHDDSPERAR